MATALETATEMYDLYVNAEKAVLQGQAYSIGDRSVTRANLVEIRKGREYWASEVLKLTNAALGVNTGTIRTRRAIIRDD